METVISKDGVRRYKCTMCGVWLEADKFSVDHTTKLKIRTSCKACVKERRKKLHPIKNVSSISFRSNPWKNH